MRGGRSGFLRRAAAGAAVLVLAVLLVALVSEVQRERHLTERYDPPGRMVSIGSHRLHLYCVGEGRPPVLLQAGSGLAYTNWEAVQSRLASVTQVCSYDRTGLGWSEPGPREPSANQATTELRRLLTASGIPGPWILVGHSLGGLYAQQFLNRYRPMTAGVVLVDAPHWDLFRRVPRLTESMNPGFLESLSPLLTHLGLHRRSLPDVPETDPSWVARQLHATSKHLRRAAQEWWAIPASAYQVRDSLSDWGDTPLVVLQAGSVALPSDWGEGEQSRYDQHTTALQKALARRSTRGRHVIVDDVGHGIPWEAPDLIAGIVDSLVREWR